MAKVELTWPIDAFDAVSIKTDDGKYIIQGIDGDQIKLTGNVDNRIGHYTKLEPSGRWLQINNTGHRSDAQFTLQLPKSKFWTIKLFCGRAQVKTENLHTRLHFWLGKGDVQVENCRGNFSISCGNADIRLKQVIETEAPVGPPPLADENDKTQQGYSENWPYWSGEHWAQWGEELGEKVIKTFLGAVPGQNRGINIQIGKGDLLMEEIEAKSCTVRSGRTDIKLRGGRIGNLDINIGRGEIDCESCLPADEWMVRTTNGDIRLALPSDTKARLDVTTRNGEIQSKTPLVRVTRQGPESWHGGRMVGSIGANTDGKLPEVRLSTLNGDIQIETKSAASQYYEKPEEEKTIMIEPDGEANAYDTPLAVLTALSEGKISIGEAERLLQKLKP